MLAEDNGVNRIEIDVHGQPEHVSAASVSGNYYAVVGLTPGAGRLLIPEDDDPGAPCVAVISDQYWTRRFGRDSSAIGQVLTLKNVPVPIVGVAPPGFFEKLPASNPDMTLPLAMSRLTGRWDDDDWRKFDGMNFLAVMGRLRPGTTPEQAAADMHATLQRFIRVQADHGIRMPAQQGGVQPARNGFDRLRWRFSQPLMILMVIVGLVLLLACVNLSGLLLARAAAPAAGDSRPLRDRRRRRRIRSGPADHPPARRRGRTRGADSDHQRRRLEGHGAGRGAHA